MDSNVMDNNDRLSDSSDKTDTSLRGLLNSHKSMSANKSPAIANRRSVPTLHTQSFTGNDRETGGTSIQPEPSTSTDEPESTLNLSLDSVVRQSLRDQKLTTNFNSNFKFGKPDDDISLRVNPLANLFYEKSNLISSSDASSDTDESSRDIDPADQSNADAKAKHSLALSNDGINKVIGKIRAKQEKWAARTVAQTHRNIPQPGTSGVLSRKRPSQTRSMEEPKTNTAPKKLNSNPGAIPVIVRNEAVNLTTQHLQKSTELQRKFNQKMKEVFTYTYDFV